MSKKHVNLTVDDDIYMMAQMSQLNISGEFNQFLKARLNTEKTTKDKLLARIDKIDIEIKELETEKIASLSRIKKIEEDLESKQLDEAKAELDALRYSGVMEEGLK